MMLEELQRRNYAETTSIVTFEPSKISLDTSTLPGSLRTRQYPRISSRVVHDRKFSPNTVAQHLAALRFFYVKTLKKALEHYRDALPEEGPSPATILSQEEVTRLIHGSSRSVGIALC